MKAKNILIAALTLALLSTVLTSTTKLASAGPQGPTIEVTPLLSQEVEVGSTYAIDIVVDNITSFYGWEFKLFYMNNALNATGATFGPFLSTGGTTFSQINVMTDNYNATHGLIYLFESLLGALPGVSGSGVIAQITFETVGIGGSRLVLHDTKLGNPSATPIAHTAVSGYVSIVETVLHDIMVDSTIYAVQTKSNATISPVPMYFDHGENEINFTITGTAGMKAYVNVTIPNDFIWVNAGPSAWVVLVNGTLVTPTIYAHLDHTHVVFMADLSTDVVEIQGEESVPEFPAMLITLAIFAFIALGIAYGLAKKRRSIVAYKTTI